MRRLRSEENFGRGVGRMTRLTLLGFECKEDAEQFLEDIKERLSEFGLNLHPEKTRLIEFGRSAIEDRKRRGEGKPETFDFLGFTHYCRKTRKGGSGWGASL